MLERCEVCPSGPTEKRQPEKYKATARNSDGESVFNNHFSDTDPQKFQIRQFEPRGET